MSKPNPAFSSMFVRTTKDYLAFKDELETMKFICKNFWEQIFRKQIDNLKTNHQGIYVLTDNRFKFLTQMSESKQFNQFIPRVSGAMINGAHFD